MPPFPFAATWANLCSRVVEGTLMPTKLATVLVLLASLAGCTTHMSSVRDAPDGPVVFVLEESQVFNLVYDAMVAAFPSAPVFDLDDPIRGFHVTRRFGPDYYTTIARIFPAIGVDLTGTPTDGYYFEVSGEGTYFDGPSKDKRLYGDILSRLRSAAIVVRVTGLHRSEYLLDRDRWRLQSGANAQDSESAQDIAERLSRLEQLHEAGAITDEEYKKKRADIVDGL